MSTTLIAIYILWFAAAILMIPNIAPYTNDLNIWKQAVVAIVTILGAPFILITEVIELILDAFLAEEWDNDDDTKIAIAQFGNPDDVELKEMAQAISEKGIHWYYFDKTVDEDFEIKQLCEHYDIVFKCYESEYMDKIK